jgi:hypothetical protein
MKIGTEGPMPPEINTLGFENSDSICLLGVEIDKDISNLDNNFSKVLEKMRSTIFYWSRFKLSLPGRIAVLKSLVLPLVSHLGSILMPSNRILNEMQNLMDDFGRGNLNVAKNRITLPTELGGLGLFCLRNFLIAQQAGWVLKAEKSKRDCWRYNLYVKSYKNVLNCNSYDFSIPRHPILSGLVKSFGEVRLHFESSGHNYKSAIFLKKPFFNRGPHDRLLVDENYLGITNNYLACEFLAKQKFEFFLIT